MKLSPEKQAKVIKNTKDVLLENNIAFEVKNNGFHFIIRTENNRYDYWPTSQKYMVNSNFKIKHGGLTALIEEIKAEIIPAKDKMDIFEIDIDDMSVDKLKETIIFLCDELNKLTEKRKV